MSLLSQSLGSRSGLGMGNTQPSGGYSPNQTATAGIPAMVGTFGEGTRGLIAGRVSLILLEGIVLGLVGFYIWTHNVQGGG